MSRARSSDHRNPSPSMRPASPRAPRSASPKSKAFLSRSLRSSTRPKGEYLAVKQTVSAAPPPKFFEVFARSDPRDFLAAFHVLDWAESPRFIRPIRSIVALLDDKMIPFSFAESNPGITTDGHRFLGTEIAVSGPRELRASTAREFCSVPARRAPPRNRSRTPFADGRNGLHVHEDPGFSTSSPT